MNLTLIILKSFNLFRFKLKQYHHKKAAASLTSFAVPQDLQYLSEGIEGRSSNPVAVLFDALLHPNADFGYEFPPMLQWRLEKQHHVPHLVLGRAAPGGAWHVSLSPT